MEIQRYPLFVITVKDMIISISRYINYKCDNSGRLYYRINF